MTPAATAETVLCLRGAAFGYGEHPVLSGVDLRVQAGEVVAILGPNGSGKSTLVKGLLGLADHVRGEVELFGMPRAEFREHARLGYVPQRHTVAGTVRATVQEVVATGRLPRKRLWSRLTHRDRALVRRAIDLVGMGDRTTVDTAELSGGQQRRVLIARALAGEPDVLLMDEPTAGVDIASQHALAGVLARLAGTGVTMLIVTHELAALADIVARVVVIDGGQVSFDGPRAEFEARASLILHDHGYQHHHHGPDDESGDGSTASAGPKGSVGAGFRVRTNLPRSSSRGLGHE